MREWVYMACQHIISLDNMSHSKEASSTPLWNKQSAAHCCLECLFLSAEKKTQRTWSNQGAEKTS